MAPVQTPLTAGWDSAPCECRFPVPPRGYAYGAHLQGTLKKTSVKTTRAMAPLSLSITQLSTRPRHEISKNHVGVAMAMTAPDHPAARSLERAFWRAVEEIGQHNSTCVARLSDEALAGYALGVEHTLIGQAESLGCDCDLAGAAAVTIDTRAWSDQLRAALGEQLRRRHPGGPVCCGRKLNEFLGTLRDWRIAMVAGDDSMFDGPWRHQANTRLENGLRRWRSKRTSSSPGLTEDEELLANQVERELRALRIYRMALFRDRSWLKRREEKRRRIEEHQEAAQPWSTKLLRPVVAQDAPAMAGETSGTAGA